MLEDKSEMQNLVGQRFYKIPLNFEMAYSIILKNNTIIQNLKTTIFKILMIHNGLNWPTGKL